MEDLDTPIQLTMVTKVFAVMFYVAAAILLTGLVAKILKSVRHPSRLKAAVAPSSDSRIGGTIRLASEVVLFRSAFFSDRWNWIFGTCFHFGLLLVLVRHLRYALDAEWCGPIVWRLITIAQPFGIYGGLALIGGVLGFSARHVVFRAVRERSGPVDRLLLLLLLVVPVSGFASAYVHSDVVAVKEFFHGIAVGDWKALPGDAVLLIHLWLVAALMIALPFGKMLHFADIFEPDSPESVVGNGRRRLKLALGLALTVALAVPAAIAAQQIATDGLGAQPADFSKLVKIHRSQDPTVMIRNHPAFLVHKQDILVYGGARLGDDSIERCVTCHAKKDASGQPVDFESPKHFCTECHEKAAVTIDCFECHNSKPIPSGQSALETPTRFAARFPDGGFFQRSSQR